MRIRPMSDVRCPMSPVMEQARMGAHLTLFEEAWMQLPRRQQPAVEADKTSDIGHRTSDEGQSHA